MTLPSLFDRLVQYRNDEIGHSAGGAKSAGYYERMGGILLHGVGELLGRLDFLAGRRLQHVAEVRRRTDEGWIVERADLTREMYQRIESLVLPDAAAATLPRPEQLYVLPAAAAESMAGVRLQPLLIYDAEANEVLFINGRRGKAAVEYLSYTTGRRLRRDTLAGEHREILRRMLDVPDQPESIEAPVVIHPAEKQQDEPPEQLAEFEKLSELGRGGMGIVYRARQLSLDRDVALKCLFRSGDPKAEARFSREILALGRVEHPHLVKIYASGAEGEQRFYAMELLDGATLHAVCAELRRTPRAPGHAVDLSAWQAAVAAAGAEARRRERPADASPPPDEPPPTDTLPAPPTVSRAYIRQVVGLIRQVCDATHALHGQRIIHRDIKPDNIMVNADGTTAVLIDLGLAQLADEVQGKLTRTRQFIGTLQYASPEQVLAARPVDVRSDVYSLGATLWELLTLRSLFGATDQTPDPELMQRILVANPERPRPLQPAVGRDLEAIVLHCLEKDPARRYPSAAALSEELRRYLAGEPVVARPIGRLTRTWRWCRRNPVVTALLAAVLLLFVGGFAAVSWNWYRAEQARQEVAASRQQYQRLAANMARNRGVILCERGDIGRGLLYLARALQVAEQAEDEALTATLRGPCGVGRPGASPANGARGRAPDHHPGRQPGRPSRADGGA